MRGNKDEVERKSQIDWRMHINSPRERLLTYIVIYLTFFLNPAPFLPLLLHGTITPKTPNYLPKIDHS